MWAMSARARVFWIILAVLVASWLAVRSLAASPARDPQTAWRLGCADDPPVPLASLLARDPRSGA